VTMKTHTAVAARLIPTLMAPATQAQAAAVTTHTAMVARPTLIPTARVPLAQVLVEAMIHMAVVARPTLIPTAQVTQAQVSAVAMIHMAVVEKQNLTHMAQATLARA
jgi:hypothetical protein